jgi:chaperonin GroEL (HSP60 family)
MPRFKHNRHHLTATILMLATSAFVAGCESTPTALERNFGSSVRNMIELQTAQPGYRGYGMDGQKSEAVWQSYRKEVADPKKVEQSIIQIQLGK